MGVCVGESERDGEGFCVRKRWSESADECVCVCVSDGVSCEKDGVRAWERF